MRLTKRQLKRIIREEYTRLKRQGLITEMNQGDLAQEAALAYEEELARCEAMDPPLPPEECIRRANQVAQEVYFMGR